MVHIDLTPNTVKKERTARSMSRQDLAAASGLPLSTIIKIEQGKVRNPRVHTARRLAAALDMSIEGLIVLLPVG